MGIPWDLFAAVLGDVVGDVFADVLGICLGRMPLGDVFWASLWASLEVMPWGLGNLFGGVFGDVPLRLSWATQIGDDFGDESLPGCLWGYLRGCLR